jgi:hypothetical protein
VSILRRPKTTTSQPDSKTQSWSISVPALMLDLVQEETALTGSTMLIMLVSALKTTSFDVLI